MTSKESKALRAGDALIFSDGVRGRVIDVGNSGVFAEWDDGQEGIIHHDDMHAVSRAAVPA